LEGERERRHFRSQEETGKGNDWLLKSNLKRRMTFFERMYSEQGIGVIDKNVLEILNRIE
jgi:hypothetical protein